MTRGLLVRLTGTDESVGDAMATLADQVTEIRPGKLELPHLGDRRPDVAAIAGDPPRDEIGYGLSVIAVVISRAPVVALVDTGRAVVRRMSRGRFVSAELPWALRQVVGGAAASTWHAAAAEILLATPPPAPRRPAEVLKRVLYLRPLVGTPAAVGGAVTHTHEVIRGLRASGVSVTAVTTDPSIAATARGEVPPPCDWRLVELPVAARALPLAMAAAGDLALLRATRREAARADLIYQRHTRFSLAGALAARCSGTPLYLEYNGSEAFFGAHWQPTPFLRLLRRCEDAILASATCIVVVAEAEKRLLAARGISPDRILVNPNGVDPDRFGTGGGAAFRRRYGIPIDAMVVGFAGSFGPWHGASILAEAFTRAQSRSQQLRLVLAGDGPELPNVVDRINRAGLADHVHVLGKLPPRDIPDMLDACDILASPHVPLPGGGEFFGSPTKLFEYMAAGRAIVASPLGQIGHVLVDEETAVFAEPGEAGSLAEALVRLAGDQSLRERLGLSAREAVAARYTWTANTRRLQERYAEQAQPCAG